MAYHLAYTVSTATSSTTFQHSFQTEAARNQFYTGKVPGNAKNIRIWPRPKYVPQQPTLWWDANKRPFADRYDLINETQQ